MRSQKILAIFPVIASLLCPINTCQSQSTNGVAFQAEGAQSTGSSDSLRPGETPTAANWPQFLESVRQIAMAYTKALPDFTCTQRILRRAKLGASGNWENVDQIVAEVSYRKKGETYRVLTIDNKPPSPDHDVRLRGFSSEGDFGNALYLLFAPESNASFRMESTDHIHGRKTVRVRFDVSQQNSKYEITSGGKRVITAYNGHCWIDLAARQVMRLESTAQDIPAGYPVRKSSRSTEYDQVEIAGKKYWLPVRTLVYMRLINEPQEKPMDFYKIIYGRETGVIFSVLEAQNEMEYKNYRKFDTEVRFLTE